MAFLKECGQMLPNPTSSNILPCGEVGKSPFAESLGHLKYLQPMVPFSSPDAVETTRSNSDTRIWVIGVS